jgi:hypothetical protein
VRHPCRRRLKNPRLWNTAPPTTQRGGVLVRLNRAGENRQVSLTEKASPAASASYGELVDQRGPGATLARPCKGPFGTHTPRQRWAPLAGTRATSVGSCPGYETRVLTTSLIWSLLPSHGRSSDCVSRALRVPALSPCGTMMGRSDVFSTTPQNFDSTTTTTVDGPDSGPHYMRSSKAACFCRGPRPSCRGKSAYSQRTAPKGAQTGPGGHPDASTPRTNSSTTSGGGDKSRKRRRNRPGSPWPPDAREPPRSSATQTAQTGTSLREQRQLVSKNPSHSSRCLTTSRVVRPVVDRDEA